MSHVRVAYTEDGFDLVASPSIETDDGLETAVSQSLFTDAPATDDELAEAGLRPEQNCGSWQDSYPEIDGDVDGSKLWLLDRAPRTDETLLRAQTYAEQALAWLIEDEVADTITVSARWYGRTGYLLIDIEIKRPGEVAPRWRRTWDAYSGKIVEAA